MSDFYINLALNVLFQVLQDTKNIKRFAKAFRKAYLTLHANRLLFLTDADRRMMGEFETEGK